jgi:hypothetical protein
MSSTSVIINICNKKQIPDAIIDLIFEYVKLDFNGGRIFIDEFIKRGIPLIHDSAYCPEELFFNKALSKLHYRMSKHMTAVIPGDFLYDTQYIFTKQYLTEFEHRKLNEITKTPGFRNDY